MLDNQQIQKNDEAKTKVLTKKSQGMTGKNDIENRPATAPAGEAGLRTEGTESTHDDTFHSGSAERRANSNFSKVHNVNNFDREFEDEIPSYSTTESRTSLDDVESDEDFIKLHNTKSNTKFTAPDEFYPSQDPSPSREDITLGRGNSSATNKSTAKAAPISSEVSSNDAKKKN